MMKYSGYALSFLAGVAITMSGSFVGDRMSTVTYDRADAIRERAAATPFVVRGESVSSTTADLLRKQDEQRKLEAEAEQAEADSIATIDDETEEESEEEAIAVVPDEPDPVVAEAEEDNNAAETAAAAAVMATLQDQVKSLTDQVNSQTSEEDETSSDDSNVAFVTPSGVKIDVNGNVIGEGSTGDEGSNTSDAEVTEDITPPSGYWKTPSGKYVDASGNIWTPSSNNQTTAPAQTEQTSLAIGVFRLPNGNLVDKDGNLVDENGSIVKEKQEAQIVHTSYSTSSPPAVGSTINIPKSVTFSANYNTSKPCPELGFKNQLLVLCELYRAYDGDSEKDYTWNKLDS